MRIGETRIMNNGQKAIIIKYKKYNDINIKFEDNTIVYHKTYNNFKKGRIRNPNIT